MTLAAIRFSRHRSSLFQFGFAAGCRLRFSSLTVRVRLADFASCRLSSVTTPQGHSFHLLLFTLPDFAFAVFRLLLNIADASLHTISRYAATADCRFTTADAAFREVATAADCLPLISLFRCCYAGQIAMPFQPPSHS